MSTGRRWLVGGIVIVTVLAAGVGWAAGARVKSPAQVAAETAPPSASLIAVPVERKTITTDVIVRGTVRHGTPQPIAVATSPLKPATPVVTSVPERDASLPEGSVALSLSGRPVLVFQGAQPSYRDLSVGMTGPDVLQLEQALERLQLTPGAVDGQFDTATAGAMAALYQAAGWAPFGLTDAQNQELRAAHEAAAAAEDRRLQAKLALESAAGPAASDLHQAQTDLATARDAAAAAAGDVASATAGQQAAQAALPAVRGADEAARATQAHDDMVAAVDVVTKTNALNAANQDLHTAQLRLAEGEATDPNTGQPTASPAELAALHAAVDQATAAITGAQADLAAAQAGVTATAAAGAAAVQTSAAAVQQAVSEAALADGDLVRATQAQGSAQASLLGAQSLVDRVTRPGAPTTLSEAVSAATREATRTSSDLAKLTQASGFQVPADEVLFLSSLPVRVDEVKVKPGELLTPDAMTVSSFRLAIDSALSLTDATLVKVGAPVTVDEPELGVTVHGSVSEVADRPGTKGTDPQHVYLEVTPDEAPDQLVGASVKLTIAVESSKGDVLAVPVSALSVTAGGTSRVQVLDGDKTRFVTVRPGLAANGLAEVTPTHGKLTEGDQVVVGDRTGGTRAP